MYIHSYNQLLNQVFKDNRAYKVPSFPFPIIPHITITIVMIFPYGLVRLILPWVCMCARADQTLYSLMSGLAPFSIMFLIIIYIVVGTNNCCGQYYLFIVH